jgi:Holliday junction resolvase
MVDSRNKGYAAEIKARDLLRKSTGLNWQRTPGSGALNEAHKMKGDLYVPEVKMVYAVEIKHYKDDHLTSKILTDKSPQLLQWWEQAVRQGKQMDKLPLLLFKFDRSKWFVMYNHPAPSTAPALKIMDYGWVSVLEEWLTSEQIKWVE